MSETQDGSVPINDRRRFNPDGSPREAADDAAASAKESQERQAPESSQSFPKTEKKGAFEINFSTFILSLASSAQISMGLIPHPATGKPEVNLVGAKQTIDILGMLEEKTRGNLDANEAGLIRQALFELRMQYVDLADSNKKNSA